MNNGTYVEVSCWTGRQLRDDKRSAIAGTLPPTQEHLAIEPKQWLQMSQHFESRFKGLVGAGHALEAACLQPGYRRPPGLGPCKALLG